MLATHSVGSDDGKVAVILHGILGSAKNWRTFARRMAARWPEWRFILVDLRHHGGSWRPEGTQSLQEVAGDLEEITRQYGPPAALIGHSYGGKVALARAAQAPVGLESVWVLDSRLDAVGELAAHNEVRQVFEALGQVRGPFDARTQATDALVQRGLPTSVVAWMGTNITRSGDQYVWRFNLDGAADMLHDYLHVDLFPVLDTTEVDVHLVRATNSGRWAEETLAELGSRERAGQLVQHELDSGHWVHVEAPDALLGVLAATFE